MIIFQWSVIILQQYNYFAVHRVSGCDNTSWALPYLIRPVTFSKISSFLKIFFMETLVRWLKLQKLKCKYKQKWILANYQNSVQPDSCSGILIQNNQDTKYDFLTVLYRLKQPVVMYINSFFFSNPKKLW